MLELIVGKIPDKFRETVKIIAAKLRGQQYAIRGTASLVWQGLDMNVDDIDVLCDKATAEAAGATYKETSQYKSYFLQTIVNGVPVEFMGDWQIKNPQGAWVFVEMDRVEVDGAFVTTIESELKMYAAMGRWSAYHKIKKQL